MIGNILKNDRFAPAYFMGDGHKRVYRYLDDRIDPWEAHQESEEEE